MMICGKTIVCASLAVIVCFSSVLSKNQLCSELSLHPNWPELARASQMCGVSQDSIVPRVMGGSRARLAEFPWFARLIYSENCAKLGLTCGGALITKRHVMTAAHCCDIGWMGNQTSQCTVSGVVLGDYDKETAVDCFGGKCLPTPINATVNRVIIHKNFSIANSQGVHHDICLLKLLQEVEISPSVSPVCLPDECNWKEPNYKWDELTAAGWGVEQQVPKPRFPAVLQTVKMMATPFNICAPLWNTNFGVTLSESHQLCAGMELGKNVCKGDSGGPVVYQGMNNVVAVGILSMSQNCSHADTFQLPAIFIRTAHFIPWILENL